MEHTTSIDSFASSLSISTSVQIGNSTYSPGDAYVEAILPLPLTDAALGSASQSSLKSVKQGTSSSSSFSRKKKGKHMSLATHPAVVIAKERCRSEAKTGDIRIVTDDEVVGECVEVVGQEAEIVFTARNIFRYLVFFVKHLGRFIDISIGLVDDKQTFRRITLTNSRSLAKVDNKVCQLPLVTGDKPGWRHVCIDLQDMTQQAFGTKHMTTAQVRIRGTCRLLRAYFQEEMYYHDELPIHLQFQRA